MKHNNKGYSIVEMFAVILIATIIVFPMITALVNSVSQNARFHNRRNAVSIAQATNEGFDRMEFDKIKGIVDNANLASPYFEVIDYDKCTTYTTGELSVNDQTLCQNLFNSTWSNFNATPENFKSYLIYYNITLSVRNSLTGASSPLPQKVKDAIALHPTSNADNPDLFYIITWIQYDEDTQADIVMEGVISND